MPSTFSSALGLEKQATGENDNIWGTKLNQVIEEIDDAVADQLSLSVAGASDTTLTAAQALFAYHSYTGTLTGNINVVVPASNKHYYISNETDGAFTLTVKTSAGKGVTVPQGALWELYCDGTDVREVTVLPLSDAPGELSNGSDTDHEIDIAASNHRAIDAYRNITLPATTIDIENTGNGGRLDNDTLDADTWYAVLSGRNTADATMVAGFKKTKAKPSGWDWYRFHGWVLTDGSSNITAFYQDGDWFFWDLMANDISASNPGVAPVDADVSTPPAEVLGQFSVDLTDVSVSAATHLVVRNPDVAESAPSSTNFSVRIGTNADQNSNGAVMLVRTNASSQIEYELDASNADISVRIKTVGWMDRRGRDG